MEANSIPAAPPGLSAAPDWQSDPAAAAADETSALDGAFGEARLRFEDMRLRVGDRIQLQVPASASLDRHFVKLIGYVDNLTLLVTAPMVNGLRVDLVEDDVVVARVFSSQRAFGFSSTVQRVCRIPYDYLHLAFPSLIQGAVIRKAPRVRTRIIASVGTPETGEQRHSGVIANLSADGALMKAPPGLFEKGQEVQLSFRVYLHGVEAYLAIGAAVRSAAEETEEGAPACSYGMQFTELAANDRMILQSMIYQQMVERPHSLV